MEDSFDLIVIGAGPGGYACAIKAAQLGMRTACIDKREAPGGTCLNVGCIPSKALLHASEKFEELSKHGAAMGLVCPKLDLDLAKMMAFKDEAVSGNTKGVSYLLNKNKITYIVGTASLKSAGHVRVQKNGGDEETILRAKHVVIATGSEPVVLPGVTVDETYIVSSTGALALSKVPQKLAIIGGGVIGVELGAVWSRLGAQVTLIETSDRILTPADPDVSKMTKRLLEKKGWTILTKTFLQSVEVVGAGKDRRCKLMVKGADNALTTLEADVTLMATGRRPCTEGLELDKADVALGPKGFIEVGSSAAYQTTLPGVYAIGDVIGGHMLAHKAMEEGCVLAEHLSHQRGGGVNYGAVPSVIYTMPEIAWVGLTETEAKEKGLSIKIGTFPLTANGRAKAVHATDGFVKLIADAQTDRLLGAHIIAPVASEMIHEFVTALEFSASSEDIARTMHAHPSFSEASKEAACAVTGLPLHM